MVVGLDRADNSGVVHGGTSNLIIETSGQGTEVTSNTQQVRVAETLTVNSDRDSLTRKRRALRRDGLNDGSVEVSETLVITVPRQLVVDRRVSKERRVKANSNEANRIIHCIILRNGCDD